VGHMPRQSSKDLCAALPVGPPVIRREGWRIRLRPGKARATGRGNVGMCGCIGAPRARRP
jgi:hypothetical protein